MPSSKLTVQERAEAELSAEAAKAAARRAGTAGDGDKEPRPILRGDCLDGEGCCTWPTGDTYEGSWVDSKHHGEGTFTWASGAVYSGPWAAGIIEGTGGRMRFANGVVYEGGWASGKPEGHGRWLWLCGVAWEGQFTRGRPVVAATGALGADAAEDAEGTWIFPASWQQRSVRGAGPSTSERRATHAPDRCRVLAETAAMAEEAKVSEQINAAWRQAAAKAAAKATKAAKAAKVKAKSARSSSNCSTGSADSSSSVGSSASSASGASGHGMSSLLQRPSFSSDSLVYSVEGMQGFEARVSAVTERRRTGTAVPKVPRSVAARGACCCGAEKMRAPCICPHRAGGAGGARSGSAAAMRPRTSSAVSRASGGGSGSARIGGGSSSRRSGANRSGGDAMAAAMRAGAAAADSAMAAVGAAAGDVAATSLTGHTQSRRNSNSAGKGLERMSTSQLSAEGGDIISLSPRAMRRRLEKGGGVRDHVQFPPARSAAAVRRTGGARSQIPLNGLTPLPAAVKASTPRQRQEVSRGQAKAKGQAKPSRGSAQKGTAGAKGGAGARGRGGGGKTVRGAGGMAVERRGAGSALGGMGDGATLVAAGISGSMVRFKSPSSVVDFQVVGSPVGTPLGSRRGSRVGSRAGSRTASQEGGMPAPAAELSQMISDRLNVVKE